MEHQNGAPPLLADIDVVVRRYGRNFTDQLSSPDARRINMQICEPTRLGVALQRSRRRRRGKPAALGENKGDVDFEAAVNRALAAGPFAESYLMRYVCMDGIRSASPSSPAAETG